MSVARCFLSDDVCRVMASSEMIFLVLFTEVLKAKLVEKYIEDLTKTFRSKNLGLSVENRVKMLIIFREHSKFWEYPGKTK